MQAAHSGRSRAGAFFAHPATLLLIGGAITTVLGGLLVPYITRSWQNHDRELERRAVLVREELEVKNELVTKIGTATANFLGASQLHPFTAADTAPRTLVDYDRAYARWSVDSAEIASQLAAYFPGSRAQRQWRDFAFNMRHVYLVVRAASESQFWLRRVAGYLQIDPSTIDGLLHDPLLPARRNPRYEAALRELTLQLEKREAEVVRQIVQTTSVLRRASDD